MTRLALLLLSLAVTVPPLTAQQSTPAFEAASVKPGDTKASGGITDLKFFPERFAATNVTLQQLIMAAYDLEGREVVGGPGWVTGAGAAIFDITAVAGSNVGENQLKLMVRSLLGRPLSITVGTRDAKRHCLQAHRT